jgi:uncharacterized iron-regulated membrane protein
MRAVWLQVHRYAGLAMAVFLFIAGATGSIIAFESEIDAWLNPQLFRATDRADRLPLSDLAARAEQADPHVQIHYVELPARRGEAAQLYATPRTNPSDGKPFQVDYDDIFMDPATGAILGTRKWGECCFEPPNLIPFLFRLHYSLHLPGAWGLWLMGGVALIWALDCFVGAYLTLPRQPPRFAKWKRAWLVRTHAGAARLNFDLHRAGGLWPWALLLVLAVSSVALNLRNEVFVPIVSAFSSVTAPIYDRPTSDKPLEPVLSFDDVERLGREEAARRGWGSRVERIYYSPEQGFYGVRVSHDRPAALGNPWLYFDGRDGHYIGADRPGSGTAGDVFIHLQYPLHSGRIAGMTGRIVISIAGLLVAMLSITGIVIWWKKRRALARERALPLPRSSSPCHSSVTDC